jgi:cell division protein FtsL
LPPLTEQGKRNHPQDRREIMEKSRARSTAHRMTAQEKVSYAAMVATMAIANLLTFVYIAPHA